MTDKQTEAVKVTKAAQAMRKAWEIFKAAGVRTMDAWREALRQAWAYVKEAARVASSVKVEMLIRSGRDKVWAAKIVGKSDKFGFDREFLNPVASERGSFKTSKTFRLNEGPVYEVNDPNGIGRGFCIVKEGQLEFVSSAYVSVALA